MFVESLPVSQGARRGGGGGGSEALVSIREVLESGCYNSATHEFWQVRSQGIVKQLYSPVNIGLHNMQSLRISSDREESFGSKAKQEHIFSAKLCAR